MGEQVEVCVAFRWDEIGHVAVDGQGKLAFPRLIRRPGVYRIVITELDGSTAVYVGEADNLQRRFAHYRSPGPSQKTNQRINALLVGALDAGGTVAISAATEARLSTRGHDDALDLTSRLNRLLAENAALVQTTLAGGHRIENL